MPITSQTYGSTNPLLAPPPVGPGVATDTFKYNGPVQPTPAPASTPSAVAVAPVAPAEPTVGETLMGIKNQAMTVQEQLNQLKAAEAAKGTYSAPTLQTDPTYESLYPAINEREIQRNQMRLFQNEINATNKVYDQLYNQKVLEGTGRLGTQRAQAARGGLLGSDFGSAQQEKVQAFNTDITNAVQAERQSKIGAIMGRVRTAVADDIAAKRLARTQDADAYLKYLSTRKETRQANLDMIAGSLLQQGLDPATMTPDELEAIGKEAGISAADIIASYSNAKTAQDTATAETDLKTRKTEAEISKLNADVENAGFFNLSEGQSRYDAAGNIIASKGKTYAPGTGSSSSVGLTAEDKRTLLGGGWSESDISTLEAGIRSEGLQSVIDAERAAGATSSQIKALEKAYGASSEDNNQFLNKEYFRSLFGADALASSAQEAGLVTGGNDYIPFNEAGDTEAYLTQLEQTVNLYRQAGYSDQDILKMMQ